MNFSVIFNDETAAYCLSNGKENYGSSHLYGAHLSKIIGNIHKNGDLLK
jgi:hypothetical protein